MNIYQTDEYRRLMKLVEAYGDFKPRVKLGENK